MTPNEVRSWFIDPIFPEILTGAIEFKYRGRILAKIPIIIPIKNRLGSRNANLS
jgi:hypothetical protein